MAAPMTALQYQLRHRMQNKGISANALEKKAGLKPSAVQNILQGRSKRPTALLLQAIAKELNCSMSDLLADTAIPIPQTSSKPKLEWNSDLFVETIKVVEELLSQKNLIVNKEVVLKFADEIYRYCMEGALSHVDRHFATWLIDKYSM